MEQECGVEVTVLSSEKDIFVKMREASDAAARVKVSKLLGHGLNWTRRVPGGVGSKMETERKV